MIRDIQQAMQKFLVVLIFCTVAHMQLMGKHELVSSDNESLVDVLIEDDIIPMQTLMESSFRISTTAKRDAIKGDKWPNNMFIYGFQKAEFKLSQIRKVKSAIADLARHTCVKFVERTTQKTFIRFRNLKKGCAAAVGYMPLGKPIDLYLGGPACQTIGTVQHEVLHALGFWHEHTRHDRDDHITVEWKNIARGKEFNFEKHKFQTLDLPYDYASVLHYRSIAFAKDGKSHTIIPKISSAEYIMGQRIRFSKVDLARLNRLYNCTGNYYKGDDLTASNYRIF